MKKILSSLLVTALALSMVACSVDQVLADINVVIQIAAGIGSAVGQVSPADSAVVSKFSNIALTGISAVQTAYNTYKASGSSTDLAKVEAAISAVQVNLSQELAAAHITNPESVAKVAAWVNLINSSLAAVIAALPQLQHPTARIAKQAAANLPTPASLQSRWQKEVCQGDKACGSLVKAPSKL